MWCDTFDADLPAVVPGALEALGDTAGIQLHTYSRLTGGRINCPSCWNTYDGLAAFFWTGEEYKPSASYITDAPEAECTFAEAVRDEWVHSCIVVVNQQPVWRPPSQLMMKLMYDVRGWTVLNDAARERIRGDVLASLRAAAERLSALTDAEKAPPHPGAAR